MTGYFYLLKNYILLLSLGIFLMSSCGSRKDMLFNTGKEKDVPNVPVYVLEEGNAHQESPNNVILPGQQLLIINLQNEDLINGLGNAQYSAPTQYDVAPDSSIALPLLGKTKIAGLTKQEAEEKINNLYKATVLKDPIFKISVLNRKVTLLGEFTAQGNYVLTRDRVNLMDVIGEAKGISSRANKKNLKIIRGDFKNPQVLSVNLQDIRSLADPRLNLQGGDIIYLEPKGIYKAIDKTGPIFTYVGIGTSLISILVLILNSR